MRFVIVLLALLGVVDSFLALRDHLSTVGEPCAINEQWDCGYANHSSYSVIARVPVAAIGIAGYLALATLALARRRVLLLIAALLGLGFALHLAGIEENVLEVWCLYCLVSHGIIVLLAALSFVWLAVRQFSRLHARRAV
jgi:uncharacterized membrane protein